MSLYFRAQILFVCLSALVGGFLWVKKAVHDSHTTPIQATVSTIDRVCEWQDINTKEVRRLPCTSDEVAGRFKQTDKGPEHLVGEAQIHFVYTAPQDGLEKQGVLKVTGEDPRFYSVKSGDALPIRVSKDDAAAYEAV